MPFLLIMLVVAIGQTTEVTAEKSGAPAVQSPEFEEKVIMPKNYGSGVTAIDVAPVWSGHGVGSGLRNEL